MVWRCLLNFIRRCLMALYEGFIEFCQRGCVVGSHYLVKQNYHPYERRLWFVIYLVCSSYGFCLMISYMKNYSENIYRIVTVNHAPQSTFRYPTLGICETTNGMDNESLIRVERALNNTLYKLYPQLRNDNATQNFIYNMAYQNRQKYSRSSRRRKSKPMETYFNYTQTLERDVRELLQNYDFRNVINQIIGNCEEVFHECLWLDKPINCCEIFREVPTMLGKCFLFNSQQNNSRLSSKLINKLEIYTEPYYFKLKLKRLYKIFILDSNDIPEYLMPIQRPEFKANGLEYNLEFTIRPIVTDKSLKTLNRNNLRCLVQHTPCTFRCINDAGKSIYRFESYTTCITKAFYVGQYVISQCVAYPLKDLVPVCKLHQLAVLEQNGFINPPSMISVSEARMRRCLPNCDTSQYVVENAYYYSRTEPTNETKHMHALSLILLHFPRTHKSRQLIRQPEEKLVSLSGILGLFLGLNVISVIEFIYLTCRAFWKKNKRNHNHKNINLLQQGVHNIRKHWRLQAKELNARRDESVLAKATKVTNQCIWQP